MKKILVWGMMAWFTAGSAQSHAALSVSNVRSLAFGTFAAGSGGTITVAPDGQRSKTGDVTLLPIGNATSAAFVISDSDRANATRTYSINLPKEGEIFLSNGPTSMEVTHFSSEPAGQGRLTAGSQTLTVGATLKVLPALPPGDYAGTFSVTVIYQ